LCYILDLFDCHHEEKGCHITSYIVKKYSDFYNERISGESIRKIIKDRRAVREKTPISEKKELEYPLTIYSRELEMRKKLSVLSRLATLPVTFSPNVKLENPCNNSCDLSLEICEKSKHSPISTISATKTFPMIDTIFKQVLSCHHIGILLTRIFMDFISEDLGDISAIIRQWLAMILNGCHNIEQGRALNYRAFELFVGKQKTSPDKQRMALKEAATRNNITRLFSKNIEMVGADNDDTFLLDPHGVPYTGQLSILKCWLGGSHKTGKGYYLDLIHTLKGEPVFSIIDDNYYDLRQRFFAIIKEFRNVLGGDGNRFLTIIVDRAIYDVGFMKTVASEKIHIITWEKNYRKGGWEAAVGDYPTETFSIMKYRNKKEDSYLYTVRFFKRRWEKEKTFAQFIIMLSKPGKAPLELSVICTDFSRGSQSAIKPMLTRWLQENDIGYLISLGINQITSYSYFTYEQIAETLTDRNITNREFSRMAAEKLKLKKDLGMLLVKREFYLEKKEHDWANAEKEKIACENQLEAKNLNTARKNSLNKNLKRSTPK
jgi:hypothetical protein